MNSKSHIVTLDARYQWRAGPIRERMSVLAIEDFDMLEDHVQAWEDLAGEALEPNPFYEPWMLMPALRSFTRGKDIRVVLVFAAEQGESVLCGVFPLQKRSRYKKLPVAAFSLWQHIYCALCTPLIRVGYARQCLDAFLDWLSLQRDCALIEFNLVSGEGPFNRLLNDCLANRGCANLVCDSYSRALFRPMENADKYLRTAISPKHWKDMRRRSRRLSEIGRLECDQLLPDGDVDTWMDEFLQLEASGWKGKQGGAFASNKASRDYFVAIAKQGFKRGKLMMSAFRLNGRPLAHKFSIITRGEAFALKTAYNEEYAHFSPGILLEVENIRHLHDRSDIEWMDSCAAQAHFINRLWLDRRKIHTVLASTGGRRGNVVVSAMPLMKQVNRRLRGFLNGTSTRKEDEKWSR